MENEPTTAEEVRAIIADFDQNGGFSPDMLKPEALALIAPELTPLVE